MFLSDRCQTDYGTGEWPRHVRLGLAASAVAAVVGCLVGAYVGWGVAHTGMVEMSYGEGVMIGAGLGSLVSFLAAFCLSGVTGWLWVRARTDSPLPEYSNARARSDAAGHAISTPWYSRALLPDRVNGLTATGFAYQTWDMHVTVHRVQDVFNSLEHVIFTGPDAQSLFLEVLVGRMVHGGPGTVPYFSLQQNPPMRTCIQRSGVFEESFHVNVMPTDNTVRVQMFNQELLSDKFLGFCDIDINEVVIGEGFPQKMQYNLLNPDNDDESNWTNEMAGALVMSFTPGHQLPANVTKALAANNTFAYDRIKHVTEKEREILTSEIKGYGDYGTWATSAGEYGDAGTGRQLRGTERV